jgi:hypothetical protein
MRTDRFSAARHSAADQAKLRDCTDPMREIDLILLEDVMRQGAIETNATARSFQMAALLLVGACVLFVLVHDLTHSNTSISAPPAMKVAGPAASVENPGLSGSEAYRAEKCAGDYVCDEDGSWDTIAGLQADPPQLRVTTTDLAEQRSP